MKAMNCPICGISESIPSPDHDHRANFSDRPPVSGEPTETHPFVDSPYGPDRCRDCDRPASWHPTGAPTDAEPTTALDDLWARMIEHAPSPLVTKYRDAVEMRLLRRLNDERACFDEQHEAEARTSASLDRADLAQAMTEAPPPRRVGIYAEAEVIAATYAQILAARLSEQPGGER